MAKEIKKKAPKKRADKYAEKVKFNGSLEDLIDISLTGAGAKKKETKPSKK